MPGVKKVLRLTLHAMTGCGVAVHDVATPASAAMFLA